MLWIKALHLIFMVTWFAGLFYLPRLFVYHAMAESENDIKPFKVMERKLFWGITTPGAVLTTVFGFWLLSLNWTNYKIMGWIHAKLGLIVLLWIYHIYCAICVNRFKEGTNQHSHVFYRWFNEFPVLILAGVVILAVVRPF